MKALIIAVALVLGATTADAGPLKWVAGAASKAPVAAGKAVVKAAVAIAKAAY